MKLTFGKSIKASIMDKLPGDAPNHVIIDNIGSYFKSGKCKIKLVGTYFEIHTKDGSLLSISIDRLGDVIKDGKIYKIQTKKPIDGVIELYY